MNNHITLTFSDQSIDWDVLVEVYRRAPLGKQNARKLKQAYQNSSVCCFAYHNDQLIGAGRAISDSIHFATICDIVVLPEFQGKGIGRQITEAVIDKLNVKKILLACVIEQEGFYRKLGFLKHKSVMALYPNVEWFKENGYLE